MSITFDQDGYPELPDFLNRKLNGIDSGPPRIPRKGNKTGIVWPKKKNWRKIEARRRERDRREGIISTPIANRRGQ